MPICPQCGRRHGLSRSLCPDCVQDENLNESVSALDEDDANGDSENGERGVAIARFQSGAEAGYFADELTRQHGIEAGVQVRERFDAVHAVWTVDYILQVSPPHVAEAAGALQTLVDATGDDAREESTTPCVTDIPAGVWMPLIL